MAQSIIIRLPDEVEGDRELARELATEAVSIGYIWTAWRTKSGAVVVRCERKVTP